MVHFIYIVCFLFLMAAWLKAEFQLRLKHQWGFKLLTALCFSVFELLILIYVLEKLTVKHEMVYAFFRDLYDHLFARVFIGFSKALTEFSASKAALSPSELRDIELQKVMFSLIITATLISVRHIAFSACHYQKSYGAFKKICRIFNKYSEPTEDLGVYWLVFITMVLVTILTGSFSHSGCLSVSGCMTFASIPSKSYVIFPYVIYLYLSYVVLYLSLVCQCKQQENVKTMCRKT